MRKIKSGVPGLDEILDGGLNEFSTTTVIGCAGAGKTTFALQFIKKGLETGTEGIFITLDENKEQIIKEAVAMGWGEILDFLDEEKLVFIDATGKEFTNFIKKELPDFVATWRGVGARIAIDPLTPVIWATKDLYEQRELLSFLMKETRKIGTVLCTLEEHGPAGNLTGAETVLPMYLADCVIHLRYRPLEVKPYRTLKVIKYRSSRHSENAHHYRFLKNIGLVVIHSTGETFPGGKLPEPMRVEILRELGTLPKEKHGKLVKLLDSLTMKDIEGIELNILIERLREYFE
ncbi:MAG: circadian clock protein KaiC [Thermoplasmata archaeon]|nr:circadian clock protein KaiC [Thermoplasmata archaeon]